MALETIHSIFAADPDYHELVEGFVDTLPERIRSMRAAVAEQNTSQLIMLVHQLRGACGSYGFHEITPLAAELESALHDAVEPSSQTLQDLAEPIEAFLSACGRMSSALA